MSQIWCKPEKLQARIVEENLAECAICGIAKTCPYPNSITFLKLSKSDSNEESTQNLKELAINSHDFADFNERTKRLNRLYREPKQPQQFPENRPLKEVAQASVNFADFQNRLHGEQKPQVKTEEETAQEWLRKQIQAKRREYM